MKTGRCNFIRFLFNGYGKVALAGVFLISLPAVGQNWILPGPFGRPVKVMDESGNWVIPIKVYEDADVDMYIPDITTEVWKLWNAPRYFADGKYVVEVFSHFKSSHLCLTEMYPGANKNDPKLQELCENYTYKVEQMLVDTRASSILTILTVRLGKGTHVSSDSVDLKKVQWPIAKLDRRTEVAVRQANLIVAKEMTDKYRCAPNCDHTF